MSQDNDQTSHEPLANMSPGALLLEGRERAGLSREQVAKELYMTLAKVSMLEEDHYGKLGSNTFARGYVRAYANLLKLDIEYILAVYDAQAQRSGLTQEYTPPKAKNANIPVGRFIVLIVGALTFLWLISMWFFNNRQAPTYKRNTPFVTPQTNSVQTSSMRQAVQPLTTIQPLADQRTGSPSAAAQSEPSSRTTSDNQAYSVMAGAASSTDSSRVGSANNERRNAAAALTLDEIRFEFSGECWLEVSDSQGDVLMTDIQRAGSRLTLKGKAPFDVKLGNAPAVDMYLNDQKINIVPALGTDVLTMKVAE